MSASETLRRYELMARLSRDSVLFLRRDDGRILEANPAAVAAYGYDHDELLALSVHDLRSPEANALTAAQHAQADARGLLFETVHRRKDGSTFPVEVSTQGAMVGTTAMRISVIRDITERKQAEDELRQSEERLRVIVENTPDHLLVQNHELRYEFVINPQLGLTEEGMLGKTDAEILSSADAENLTKIKRQVLETGQTVTANVALQDQQGQQVFFEGAYVPRRDATGRINGLVGYFRNVSERKRAEEALRQVARLYAVLSRVNETIVRCRREQDLHEEVCRILVEVGGYPLAWIGRVDGNRVVPTAVCGPAKDYVGEITVTVDGELGRGPTGTSIREGRAVVNQNFASDQVVAPWRERAARYGFHASSAFPLRRQGTVIGALTVYSRELLPFDAEQTALLEALSADVSYAHDALEDERLRALAESSLAESETALREADQQKSRFLAVLSHELRNPLTPIHNSLFILDRASPGGEQANRAKAVIERQVSQLTRLVDDLLDVTRIVSGKLRLQPARFDLAQMLHRTADDHRTVFAGAGIDLDVQVCREPVWMLGDESRMAQAAANLLGNAVKFTERGGRAVLALEADVATGTAIIRVQDTGAGIRPDFLPKLFEPFAQADSSLDRSNSGLGLGLALVKSVIELHGGTVEAHSDGAGKGTEFVVRAPIDAEAVRALDARRRPSSHPPPRRVLVIEDNIDAANSLKDALEFGAHQVEVASNGPEGIKRAREFKPDIVICDIGLPGMSGYEVAKAFRDDETLRSTYLVALTGYTQAEDQQRAAEAGFDGHIAKPASLKKIEQVLKALPAT